MQREYPAQLPRLGGMGRMAAWLLIGVVWVFCLSNTPAVAQSEATNPSTSKSQVTWTIGVNLEESPDGPIVKSVVPNSPAAKARIRAGDRIYLAHGRKIVTIKNLVDAIQASEGKAILLRVRGGDGVYTAITVWPKSTKVTGVPPSNTRPKAQSTASESAKVSYYAQIGGTYVKATTALIVAQRHLSTPGWKGLRAYVRSTDKGHRAIIGHFDNRALIDRFCGQVAKMAPCVVIANLSNLKSPAQVTAGAKTGGTTPKAPSESPAPEANRYYAQVGGSYSDAKAALSAAQRHLSTPGWKGLRAYVKSTGGVHRAVVGHFDKRTFIDRFCGQVVKKTSCVVMTNPSDLKGAAIVMAGTKYEGPKSPNVSASDFVLSLPKRVDPKRFTMRKISGTRFVYQLDNIDATWTAYPSTNGRSVIVEDRMYGFPKDSKFPEFVRTQDKQLSTQFQIRTETVNGKTERYLWAGRTVTLNGVADVADFQNAAYALAKDLTAFFLAFEKRGQAAAHLPMNYPSFLRNMNGVLKGQFCTQSKNYYYLVFNRGFDSPCEKRFGVAFASCAAAPPVAPRTGIRWKSATIESDAEAKANLSLLADCIRFYNSFYWRKADSEKAKVLPVDSFTGYMKFDSPHLLKAIN